MFLKSIKIKNYKSLKDIELNDLSGLNALIGPNMSGKSNFIDALLFLLEGTEENFLEALNRRGGFKSISHMQKVNQNIEIELIFEIDTSLRNKILGKYIKNDFQSGTPEDKIFNSNFLKKLRYKLSFKLTDLDSSIFQEDLYTPNIMNQNTEFSIIKQFKTKYGPSSSIWGVATERTLLQEQINSIKQDKIKIFKTANKPSSTGPWDQNNPNFKLLFSRNTNNKLEDEIISYFINYIVNINWLSPYKNILHRVKTSEKENLFPDASNLARVILYLRTNLPNKFEEFAKQVNYVVPEVKSIMTPIENNEVTISINEYKEVFHSLENLSAGIKSALSIIATLAISNKNDLILIEEPENHLHPIAIRRLTDILKSYSSDIQIILTTHSPAIISNFYICNTHLFTKNKEGSTVITEITQENIRRVVSELGVIPSDIFEHDTIVFVEGIYDDIVWKIFKKKSNNKIQDICFVPTDGWQNIKSYAGINLLQRRRVKPSIFVVWDGDLDRKEETEKAKERMIETLKKDFNMTKDNFLPLPKGEIECYLLDIKAWFKTWHNLKNKVGKEKLKEKFKHIEESTDQYKGTVLDTVTL